MKYFLLSLTCAFAVSLAAPARAQMMGGHTPPAPMTPGQFSAARIGQNVQIAVQVVRRNRANISAELLAQQSQTLSKRTGKRVSLYFPDGTPTIMGAAADVNAGAVLFVYGVLTKPGHVDVKRLVVDTRFVHIQ